MARTSGAALTYRPDLECCEAVGPKGRRRVGELRDEGLRGGLVEDEWSCRCRTEVCFIHVHGLCLHVRACVRVSVCVRACVCVHVDPVAAVSTTHGTPLVRVVIVIHGQNRRRSRQQRI